MARVLIVGGLVAVALAVFAIADCALTARAQVRALPKWLWVVLIAVLPVIGGLLWFLIGRGAVPATPVRRPTGPDDDPDFLRSTGRRITSTLPAPASDDADWRRLEQELANLDSDADADDDGESRRR